MGLPVRETADPPVHLLVLPIRQTDLPTEEDVASQTARAIQRPRPLCSYWYNSKPTPELWRSADVTIAFAVLFGIFLASKGEYVQQDLQQYLLVRLTVRNMLLLFLYAVLWPFLFSSLGLYDFAEPRTPREEALRIVGACTLITATTGLLLVGGGSDAFQPAAIGFFWILTIVGILAARHLIRLMFAAKRIDTPRQVLIVGSGPRALRAYRQLTGNPAANREVVGFVDSAKRVFYEEIHSKTIGALEDLEDILMHRVVDEVLIALPIRSCYQEIQNTIAVCERVGIEARYPADVFSCALARAEVEGSANMRVVALKVVKDDLRRVCKRTIDVILAGCGLVLCAPLLLLIALAIKLSSSGPVLFVQQRYGYNKRLFPMYKFRTMVVDAEARQVGLEHLNEVSGPVFKIKSDPRVTPLGRILRRTSLDELPQLFNVLKGDMSLVGPRPLPLRDVQGFAEARLMRRFSVLPGLTCLWQISGRNNVGFEDWVRLDLDYIDRWSLSLDFKILLMTIPAVLRGTGAT